MFLDFLFDSQRNQFIKTVSKQSDKALDMLKATPELINEEDDQGSSVLHICAKVNYAKLIEHAASCSLISDVNIKNRTGATPLHVAAFNGRTDAVRALLAAGADINATAEHRFTPIMGAVCENHLDIVSLLIEMGAEVDAFRGEHQRGLIHDLLKQKRFAMIELLLSQGMTPDVTDTTDGYTLLDGAVLMGDSQALELMLKYKANLTFRNAYGKSALHYAAMNNRIAFIKPLLEGGADINTKDDAGFAPLHVACYAKHLDMIRCLVKNGADVNVRTNEDFTPLARAMQQGNKEVARLLQELGGFF